MIHLWSDYDDKYGNGIFVAMELVVVRGAAVNFPAATHPQELIIPAHCADTWLVSTLGMYLMRLTS